MLDKIVITHMPLLLLARNKGRKPDLVRFLPEQSQHFILEHIHTLETKSEKADSNLDSTDSGGSSSRGMPLWTFSFKFMYLTFKSPRTDSSVDPNSFLAELLGKFLFKVHRITLFMSFT